MATGTSPTVTSPAFHANDPEQTTDYRTLSVLAIISLVFGLAAPLKTPPAVIARLNVEVNAIAREPDFKANMVKSFLPSAFSITAFRCSSRRP